MSARRYYQLVASLPALPAHFTAARERPISRLQLERRLALLDPEDAQQLAAVEDLLQWDRLTLEHSDADVLARARATMPALRVPGLRRIVRDRLELRTAMAALRRRLAGDEAPGRHEPWGFGRWVDHMRRHWHEPNLGMDHVMPWVPDAHALMADGDYAGLERLLLDEVWRQLERASHGHYFDLAAVVIYVLRGTLVARWVTYSGPSALTRFERMAAEGLGSHRNLFGSDTAGEERA